MQLETQTQNPPPNPFQEGIPTDLTPLNIIRTETVLSKLPVHNLAKKGRVDIQITRFGPRGEVELKWEVSYSERYGQARQLAYKLDTIVIDSAVEEAGRPLPERVRLGSLNQIALELGLDPDQGPNARNLKRAFLQNASAFITARVKYKTNDGTENTIEAGFTRYTVIFTGQKFSDGTKADSVYIELHPRYREVLNNAPVRPLNLEYKKQLAPGPQRFYEIVSYKIFASLKYNHPVAKLPYSEYCTFSAQQRYFDYDHFKKQMYKIHRPHLQSGYITKIHYDQATDEQGRADWIMCYVPGPKARVEYSTFTGKRPRMIDTAAVNQLAAGENVTPPIRRPRQKSLLLQPSVEAEPLVALTSRGVSETAARKLLTDLPAGYAVLETLEWGDQQVAAQPGKFTNPPGFYISLLRERMTPPSTFESSQSRKTRQEAEFARQQAIQQAEERRLAEEAAEEKQLEEFQASQPQAFQALYSQAKASLYAEHPKMAEFAKGREASSLHDGAIRARIKLALRAARAQAEAAFAASVKATLAIPLLPAPQTLPAMPEKEPSKP